MISIYYEKKNDFIVHYGIMGMKWGVRRYQNEDGSLTDLGKKRLYSYHSKINKLQSRVDKANKQYDIQTQKYATKANKLAAKSAKLKNKALNGHFISDDKRAAMSLKADRLKAKSDKIMIKANKYKTKSEVLTAKIHSYNNKIAQLTTDENVVKGKASVRRYLES